MPQFTDIVFSFSLNSTTPPFESITAKSNVRTLRELKDARLAVGTQFGLSIIKDNKVDCTYD